MIFHIGDVYTCKQLILTIFNMNPDIPQNILNACYNEASKVCGLITRSEYIDTRDRTAFEFAFDHNVSKEVFISLSNIITNCLVTSIRSNSNIINSFPELYGKINLATDEEVFDLVYRAINHLDASVENASYFLYLLT